MGYEVNTGLLGGYIGLAFPKIKTEPEKGPGLLSLNGGYLGLRVGLKEGESGFLASLKASIHRKRVDGENLAPLAIPRML